jgi:hypothetical protein
MKQDINAATATALLQKTKRASMTGSSHPGTIQM